jgi:protein-S-isoprenylcysteine O-methyltransferase Ste14
LRPVPFSAGLIYGIIFWITFALWILPEILFWKVKRSTDATKLRDKGSLDLIVILFWAGIAADFLFSFLFPQTAISWRRISVFIIGIFLMTTGIALRWYCILILGKFFTFDVAIHSGQPLIETGPYRYIRHPSYTGALLTLAGFGLALGNWAGLAATLLSMGVAYSYRIPVEEAALTASLGDSYKEYVSRTRRLVPFLF